MIPVASGTFQALPATLIPLRSTSVAFGRGRCFSGCHLAAAADGTDVVRAGAAGKQTAEATRLPRDAVYGASSVQDGMLPREDRRDHYEHSREEYCECDEHIPEGKETQEHTFQHEA